MAYVDGYRLKMSDGTTVNVIPHGPKTELNVGPLSIAITTTQTSTSVSVSCELDDRGVDIPIATVKKVRLQKPSKVLESEPESATRGASRTCFVCKGVRYCITNGCRQTPCGWLCSG